MGPRELGVVRAVLVVVTVLTASRAHAFRTSSDKAELAGAGVVAWTRPSFAFAISGSPPVPLSIDDVLLALDAARTTWAVPQCAAPALVASGISGLPAKSGDGRNSIEWVDSDWLARGFPETSPGATDVVYEKQDGQWHIVEADVYLNAEMFQWSSLPSADVYLQAVLVHELGHALGLLHPCEVSPKLSDPSAPLCGAVPDAQESAMFPEYDPGQSALGPDDEAGLCFLYPRTPCTQGGCPSGQSCVDGVCRQDCAGPGCSSGAAEIGDPCVVHSDCQSSACIDGSCMKGCAGPSGCSGGDCMSAEGVGFCASASVGLGEPCSSASGCLGQRCIQVDNLEPACTRLCGTGCPTGWHCGAVGADDVCVPESEPEPSSCAIAPPGTRRGARWVVLGLLLLWCARRRSARSGQEEPR